LKVKIRPAYKYLCAPRVYDILLIIIIIIIVIIIIIIVIITVKDVSGPNISMYDPFKNIIKEIVKKLVSFSHFHLMSASFYAYGDFVPFSLRSFLTFGAI
jgi:hypothetical protein